jgi:hypothetical protein
VEIEALIALLISCLDYLQVCKLVYEVVELVSSVYPNALSSRKLRSHFIRFATIATLALGTLLIEVDLAFPAH